MKKENFNDSFTQKEAAEFKKRLTKKTASQKKLEAKLESGEITFKKYFRRTARRVKAGKGGLAEFLCNKASLQNVLKEAEAMVLDEYESSVKQAEARRVKFSIENALTANTTKHAAQLAFIAGLRWMGIFWQESLASAGRPVDPQWEKAEQILIANPKLTAGQVWIKLGRPGKFPSFKRTLSRKRAKLGMSNW